MCHKTQKRGGAEMKWSKWSLDRIRDGRKTLTSRTKRFDDDPEVIAVFGPLPLWFITKYLYKPEGAESPDELQRKVNQIFRRRVSPDRELFVHVIDPQKVMEANPD